MGKIVVFVDGGNISYIGSNLENIEVVVVDADNLKEGMGYTGEDVDKIFERETTGLKEINYDVPPEATEVMAVQAYKAPEPWKPKPGEWCWTEVDGLNEFKLTKFDGYKDGQKYYQFDGVLPMEEVVSMEGRIDPQEVIEDLIKAAGSDTLEGDYWHTIQTPATDAPHGFDVNVWNDGHEMKITAYARVIGDDQKLRTSSLHPLMTHTLSSEEIGRINAGIKENQLAAMRDLASSAPGGVSMEDAMKNLLSMDPKSDPELK